MEAGPPSRAAPGETETRSRKRPPSYIGRKFLRMARGFWSGETKREAWLLTGGVLLFVILNLAAALGVNRWNRYFFEPLVEFVNGLLNAILAALAFIGVLWAVGGGIQFQAFGRAISIPGYMVIAAVIYSGLTSVGMLLIGRPLIDRVEQKNAGEARLR